MSHHSKTRPRASYILIVSLSTDVSIKEIGSDESIDHQELLDVQDSKQSCNSETKRMIDEVIEWLVFAIV
ncbi:hypothetical protein GBA52_010576 [Prunus armeniaca]|nr:hypothetical protein GBA52_010576 [Prunus armeniaca]